MASNLWDAQIKVNGKQVYLGRFNKIEDAANAYDKAAVKFFGEHARPNFCGNDADLYEFATGR